MESITIKYSEFNSITIMGLGHQDGNVIFPPGTTTNIKPNQSKLVMGGCRAYSENLITKHKTLSYPIYLEFDISKMVYAQSSPPMTLITRKADEKPFYAFASWFDTRFGIEALHFSKDTVFHLTLDPIYKDEQQPPPPHELKGKNRYTVSNLGFDILTMHVGYAPFLNDDPLEDFNERLGAHFGPGA